MNQQNAVFVDSLNARKDSLLRQITDIQNDLLRLQEALQEKVSGSRVKYKEAATPAPNFQDFVTKLVSSRPITPITTNEFSSEERVPIDEQGEIPCISSVTGNGFCRPLVRCALFYSDIPELRKQPCVLHDGDLGVCCPERVVESEYYYPWNLMDAAGTPKSSSIGQNFIIFLSLRGTWESVLFSLKIIARIERIRSPIPNGAQHVGSLILHSDGVIRVKTATLMDLCGHFLNRKSRNIVHTTQITAV